MCKPHPYDDADGRHAGGGHDFGTVGNEVEQDGDDGFRSMVEFIPQHRGEVTAPGEKLSIYISPDVRAHMTTIEFTYSCRIQLRLHINTANRNNYTAYKIAFLCSWVGSVIS